MTFPEFDKFFEGLIDECREMRDTKGKEYAHSESRFANFDRASERLGIGREMVANVYLHKHLDAIDSYILHKESYSGENIRGRIKDAMVYLSLIAGMIDDSMDKASLREPADLAQLRIGQEQALNSPPNLCNDYIATCFYCLKPITSKQHYTGLARNRGSAHTECWHTEWNKRELLSPDRNKAE